MSMDSNSSAVPDYSFTLKMEDGFDRKRSLMWIADNYHLPCLYSLAYVFVVYAGQTFMKPKPALALKLPMFVWNLALAVFSAAGAIRMLPELFHALRYFGFRHSICNFSYYDESNVTAFWTFVFTLSKVAELFDTLFLILRKRNVIFLHWFHHSSVLVFTWIALGNRAAFGRWFISMNYCVHTVMYSYYALSALNIKLPKPLAMFITVSQLSQMVFGFYVSLRSLLYVINGEVCEVRMGTAVSAIALYLAYGLLFAHFFVNTYMRRKRKTQ